MPRPRFRRMTQKGRRALATGLAVCAWSLACLTIPLMGDRLSTLNMLGLPLDQTFALYGGLIVFGLLVALFNRHVDHLAANDPIDE